jgi:hypothetical protein
LTLEGGRVSCSPISHSSSQSGEGPYLFSGLAGEP